MIISCMRHDVKTLLLGWLISSSIVWKGRFTEICSKSWIGQFSGKQLKVFYLFLSLSYLSQVIWIVRIQAFSLRSLSYFNFFTKFLIVYHLLRRLANQSFTFLILIPIEIKIVFNLSRILFKNILLSCILILFFVIINLGSGQDMLSIIL